MAATVRINDKYCKGCGLCVEVCAEDVLYMKDVINEVGINAAAVKSDGICKACMNCCLICPDACIEIEK